MTHVNYPKFDDMFKGADKHLVGFDRVFDRLFDMSQTSQWNNGTNYPPYNIVKTDDTTYLIEMAVAGFTKDEIGVEVSGDILNVRGEKTSTEDPSKAEYLYKGLALRNFSRNFTLSENVEVEGAEVDNGMLTLRLRRITPTPEGVRKIDVTSPTGDYRRPEFLTENQKE
jgi:molecular chaperone IbpA